MRNKTNISYAIRIYEILDWLNDVVLTIIIAIKWYDNLYNYSYRNLLNRNLYVCMLVINIYCRDLINY